MKIPVGFWRIWSYSARADQWTPGDWGTENACLGRLERLRKHRKPGEAFVARPLAWRPAGDPIARRLAAGVRRALDESETRTLRKGA